MSSTMNELHSRAVDARAASGEVKGPGSAMNARAVSGEVKSP